MKRVVITGMGVVTPIGNNIETYTESLKNGVSGGAPITHFDASLFKTQFACEVKNFQPEPIIDKKEVRRLDKYSQFAMVAAHEAMTMSGIDLEKTDLDRAGIIFGSGIGGLLTIEQEISAFATGNGTPRYNPFLIPKMISNMAAGLMAIKYGFRGLNYAPVSACATSNHALINALDYIRLGKADIIISGGSEATICATGIGGFNAMHAMSTRNDSPQTASRPYDKTRDGFVLGEGAGVLILEELNHAKKRGAHILGEIIGGGMSCDAYHMTAPHPEGLGVISCMKAALRDAHINPSEIDYVNTHGTSTALGDMSETRALSEFFGEAIYNANISSTKSMTGHLLGAAGAIEAAACLLGIEHKFVPPTINHTEADPEIDPRLNLTLNVAQDRKLNIVMSNGFGFGGHNTTVLFKKF